MAVKEPRTKTIRIRLTESEFKTLTRLRRREPYAKWVRRRLFSEPIELYETRRQTLEKALFLVREHRHVLSREASNLNQISRLFNYGESPNTDFIRETMQALKQHHTDIYQPIKEIYNALCKQG